ncbi:MAG TPA: hypothetical protein VNQ76_01235 [Planctomicrobium sp.]|nr:hypothetical protein [Planctomicrobium sp.]
MRMLSLAVLMTLGFAALIGCGQTNELDRIILSGQVSYDGQPVPFGSVWFEPTMSAGQMAPTGFAIIRNGQFKTKAEDAPIAGPYNVRISGYPEETPRVDDEEQRIVLFPQYIMEMELVSTKVPMNLEVPKQQKATVNQRGKNR